jgi:hypothetical protein
MVTPSDERAGLKCVGNTQCHVNYSHINISQQATSKEIRGKYAAKFVAKHEKKSRTEMVTMKNVVF